MRAPAGRAQAEVEEQLQHPPSPVGLTVTLEGAGVGERRPDAERAVRVGVGALVAAVRDVELADALEHPGERERRGGVVRRPAGARVDHRAGDAVGNPDERDDVAGVVLEHRPDDPLVPAAEVGEVALGDERAGDVALVRRVQDRVLELAQ